ncbi:MAG: methionine--tRNA ligase [Cyanobacteria bacterium SIG30]|nr:methionine--tRNA ligase [Cyanobacteria bacterium SIG30]
MERFYLTTAIDYVNGAPHIGHAYEKIITDIIHRHYKQRCDNTFFLTGTDEHGIKIQKTAKENGTTPKEMCDKNSSYFKEAWQLLDIDYDRFIRTTDEDHKKIVQGIFEKLLKQGDIYKHSYKGLYCSGCECFLNAKDLDENGNCPIHGKKPDEISEENYFFKLSKYKDAIIKHIKENPDFIKPAFRANEVINQLQDIEDISVSRSITNVNWGIPVLSDPEQIIYVWIDALSNYITALGYNVDGNHGELFKKFWPVDVHVIGKDILKFHSIYWIAILMALNVELPKSIYAHGWIMINKDKMSKSIGNVISPKSVMDAFELKEADALRYFMAITAQNGRDGNYSDEEFKEKVNADLANNFGNLLNRTLNMSVKYFDGTILNEHINESELSNKVQETIKKVKSAFDEYDVASAGNSIIELADCANKYINDNAPWTLAKEGDMEKCGKVLYTILDTMAALSILIKPFCPNIAQKVAEQLKINTDLKLDEIKTGLLKEGKLISKEEIKPVFLRLDSEFADKK